MADDATQTREHAELIMLYEQATEDIRAFQERQTQVTNYTLLAYAALFTLKQTATTVMASNSMLRDAVMSHLALIAMLASGAWILLLHAAIQRARRKVQAAREHFGKPFQSASGTKHRSVLGFERWDVPVVGLMLGAVIAGYLITT